jgi:hypothetical protein
VHLPETSDVLAQAPGRSPFGTPRDVAYLHDIRAYQNCVAATVQRFGGFVAKYTGHSVLVYFGYPQPHEDDAERAVQAGLALIVAVGRLSSVEPRHFDSRGLPPARIASEPRHTGRIAGKRDKARECRSSESGDGNEVQQKRRPPGVATASLKTGELCLLRAAQEVFAVGQARRLGQNPAG